jgi:SnoaL-like domain
MSDDALLQRISRIEDRLDIGQLPIRYALAVDQRDVNAWVSLFVPTVSVGRLGTGRDALRSQIEPQLRKFYRSIHQIVGQRIELVDDGVARGQTYCRAEHEVGDRWIVMAIRYDDKYRKVDGEWLFESRRERHWYANDLIERPQGAAFNSWTPTAPAPDLPHADATWSSFWSGHDTTLLTQDP